MYHPDNFTLGGKDEPEHTLGERISAGFFDVMGVKPLRGRNFKADEDHVGAAPVALLSEGFWKSKFGSAPDILGRSVALDGVAYTVVGVIPGSFSFSQVGFVPGDVYIPIGQGTDMEMQNRQMTAGNSVVGRLKSGAARKFPASARCGLGGQSWLQVEGSRLGDCLISRRALFELQVGSLSSTLRERIAHRCHTRSVDSHHAGFHT